MSTPQPEQKRSSRSKRDPSSPLTIRIQDRDIEIISAVYAHRWLTTQMIVLLADSPGCIDPSETHYGEEGIYTHNGGQVPRLRSCALRDNAPLLMDSI